MKSLLKLSLKSVLGCVLIVSLVTNVFAAQFEPSKTSTLITSFTTAGYSSQIDVSGITLKYESSDVTTLTPALSYVLGFNVSNADGLKGMSLKVVIYNDPTGNRVAANIDGSTTTGDAFVFTWDQNDVASPDANPDPLIVYTEGANSLNAPWILYGNSSNLRDFKNDTYPTSYDFFIPFGLAANAVASDSWKIVVYVTNGAGTSTDSVAFGSPLAVQWFGQVAILEEEVEGIPTMSWGQVEYDAIYSDSSSAAEVSVRYTSNGNFDTYVSGSSSWSFIPAGATTSIGSVYLNTNPTENGTFGIRINRTAYNILEQTGGYVSNSGFIQMSSTWTTLDSNQSFTSSSGVIIDYFLYLQLAGEFGNGSYFGYMGFGISNTIPN
jgi:hypothetical protein